MGEGDAEETTTAGSEACGLRTQERRDREEKVSPEKDETGGGRSTHE